MMRILLCCLFISFCVSAGGIEDFLKNACNLKVIAGVSGDVRKQRMKNSAEIFTQGFVQGMNKIVYADSCTFSESALQDSDFIYLTAGFPENDEHMLVEASPLKIGKKNIAVNGINPVTKSAAVITVIPNPYNPQRHGLLVFGGSYPVFETAVSYLLSCDLTASFYVFSEGSLLQSGVYDENYTVVHVNDYANHARIEKQYYNECVSVRRGLLDFYYGSDIPVWKAEHMAQELYLEFERLRKSLRIGILKGRIRVYLYESDSKKSYYSGRMAHVYADQATNTVHVAIPGNDKKIPAESLYQYLYMHYYGNMQFVFFYGLQQFLCGNQYFQKTVQSFKNGSQVSVSALFDNSIYTDLGVHYTAGSFIEFCNDSYGLTPIKNAAQSRGSIQPVWSKFFDEHIDAVSLKFHRYMYGFLKRR